MALDSDYTLTALREDIFGGIYPAGEQLPPVVDLAREYASTPAAVRAALRVLIDEGLVAGTSGPLGRGFAVRDGTAAATLAAQRRLIEDAGALLGELGRLGSLEQRAAAQAWRQRARWLGFETR